PDHPDEWIDNIDGVNVLLYRLPELRQAIAAGRPVVLVEGEGKVEALRKRNIIATTWPMGALAVKNWQPQFTEMLRGADIILAPDNDTPGRNAMDEAARKLNGHAHSIHIVNLEAAWPECPEGGGVDDLFATKKDEQETTQWLLGLLRQAPLWRK